MRIRQRESRWMLIWCWMLATVSVLLIAGRSAEACHGSHCANGAALRSSIQQRMRNRALQQRLQSQEGTRRAERTAERARRAARRARRRARGY